MNWWLILSYYHQFNNVIQILRSDLKQWQKAIGTNKPNFLQLCGNYFCLIKLYRATYLKSLVSYIILSKRSNFCVTYINFLPIIKWIPQFFLKWKLFIERERGEREIHRRLSRCTQQGGLAPVSDWGSTVGPNWIFHAGALNISKSTFLGLSIIVLMKKVKKNHVLATFERKSYHTQTHRHVEKSPSLFTIP